ncbi:MAG: hypothetical protein RSD71_18055, partial [Flavobacterium sp.]
MKNYYFLFLLGLSFWSHAQVGIGTSLPNSSTQLDVAATNKGILIPRVSLTSTLDKTTIAGGNVNSLLVFNTQTISDIVPGYYYWYVDKWYRMGSADTETITTLVDNKNGTITYTNEKGLPVTINLASGPQGVPGTNGKNGVDGKSAYEIWKEITKNNTATITDYLAAVKGDTGLAGTNGKGITTTVDNGNGTFTITYTDGSTFTTSNLTGAQGVAGTNGTNGVDGKSAYEIWKETTNTTTSTVTDYLAAIKGDTGAQGPQGIAGKGITTTVDNGNGTFTITYTDGSTFTTSDLTGAQGVAGKSAFEVWKETTNNTTATITDYLAAIKGDTGAQGPQG